MQPIILIVFLALIDKLARMVFMSKITPEVALNRAIEKAGGISALAKSLDLSGHAVIHQWRLNRVPAEQCPRIESLTGVPCEELRPDIAWSVLRSNPAKSAPANISNTATENVAQGVANV